GTSVSSYTSSNVWVNLGNNIIPANGSLNIYMQVLSSGTEFDGVYWGANPLWTSTYGQYDNGANVFSFYDNFAGTTLNTTKWSSVTTTGTVTVDNGITIADNGGGAGEGIVSKIGIPPDSVFEIYRASQTAGDYSTYALALFNTPTLGTATTGYEYEGYTGGYFSTTSTEYSETNSISTATPFPSAPVIVGIAWLATGNEKTEINGIFTSYNDSSITISSMIYPGIGNSASSVNTAQTDYWARVRAYPPDGTDPVMTSITLLLVGSYISASIPVPEWTTLSGKPYITVSAKGISNGLSNIPNDGADFGPDTLLGTNSIGQYGPPYTQTSGIQEAWNYSVATASVNTISGALVVKPIHLLGGPFYINAPITFSAPSGKIVQNPKIEGDSSMAPYIYCNINDAYAITYDPNSFNYVNIRVSNMQPAVLSGYSPLGFINIDFSTVSAHAYTCTFESYNLDISGSGWTEAPIYLNGMQQIYMYNYESYSTEGTYPSGYFNCNNVISMVGGYFGGSPTFSTPPSNDTSVAIVGVTFNTLIVENVTSVVIIGAYSYTTQIYLNSDISSLTIIGGGSNQGITTPIVNVLTPGDTWTVGSLILKGLTIAGQSTFSIVGPGITVLNSDITLAVGSGVTVTYPLIVPTTPSVPASGTAQQNTNPYPVNVYLYGGTVTAIYYTPDGGTAVQIGTSGPATVHLNPNDSITLTYSVAPTWVWMKA
ncbi:MAG: hypothetical protein QW203_07675, partial [Thermoplasmatales archaeon]